MSTLAAIFDYIAKDSIHFMVFMVGSVMGCAWIAGKIAQHKINPEKKTEE